MKRLCVLLFPLICVLTLQQNLYAQPNAPRLLFPADGETSASTTPIFLWESSAGTNSFTLEILNNENQVIHREIIKNAVTFQVASGVLQHVTPYFWRVNTIDASGESEWSALWSFMTQPNFWSCIDDDDCDGIPNEIELCKLHTDPELKTLFVRPKKKNSSGGWEYWETFIKLFPSPNPGFAHIPAFFEAGIEIVVIGCCSNPPCEASCHPQYPRFDNFDYDPANDPEKPACDIMEIECNMEKNSEGAGVYCADYSYSKGHTIFAAYGTIVVDGQATLAPTWSWDTLGYTPRNKKFHDYFIPRIFPFPLNNYFEEGAYPIIDFNKLPVVTHCGQPGNYCTKKQSNEPER